MSARIRTVETVTVVMSLVRHPKIWQVFFPARPYFAANLWA
jgi:hypothetical protein